MTLQPGATDVLLSIQTIDDFVKQPDRLLKVQLGEGLDYEVVDTYQQASIKILDNDLPEISIAAINESSIQEGQLAEFRISTFNLLTEDLEIAIQSQLTENLTSEIIPDKFTIPAGTKSKILQIQTDTDELVEEDGEIFIKLLESSAYNIQIARDRALLQVIDTNLPTASIETNLGEITEGGQISFQVELLPAVTLEETEISVKHEFITDGDSRVEWKTLAVSPGDTEVTYSLNIQDTSQLNFDKSVTATLIPTWNSEVGTYNYRVNTDKESVQVRIIDNDFPPGISIYALNDTVNEGDSAEFLLQSSSPVTENQIIQLEITGTSELVNHPLNFEGEIATGQRQAKIAIPTLDDDEFKQNGMMKLQVLPRQGYSVARINSSATTTIVDNDYLPGVAVIAEDLLVTEGEELRYLIRAGEVSSTDRIIQYSIETLGEFIADYRPRTVTLLAESKETIISIPTIDDFIYEIDGRFHLFWKTIQSM